jgi:hypothetical protein
VDLRLTDPKERSSGSGRQDHPIPNSYYGRVVDMPKNPDKSKAVAVEVCGAMPGRYRFTVSEHGRGEYFVTVSGEDGKYGSQSQPLRLHADGGRVCQYHFRFLMGEGKVAILWLDSSGHPLGFSEYPGCETLPTA